MSIEQLESIAQAMVAPGKGIIAIDESNNTIKKRFDAVGVPNTEENRRAYREMLLTTPGLNQHISGAILYDETIPSRPRPACRSPRSCWMPASCRASRWIAAHSRWPASPESW